MIAYEVKMKFESLEKYKKRIAISIANAAFISLACIPLVEAMQFKDMKFIGVFTTVIDGPSLAQMKGYTSRTANSCTFGTGDTALTFTWEDHFEILCMQKVSKSTGVHIGKQKVVDHMEDSGGIYRIRSDDGRIFYLCYGKMVGNSLRGPLQVFYLMGPNQEKHYQVMTISELQKHVKSNLASLYRSDALYLRDAYVSGSEIVVPLGNKNGNDGTFHLLWDEDAQWFGIEYRTY